MSSNYPGALPFMAAQLVNSTLETTRVFWRTKLGLSEEIINDPRPIEIIIKENQPCSTSSNTTSLPSS